MNLEFSRSITAKVLGIAALALLMLIPLGQVNSLIAERQARADEAAAQIARRWGAVQHVGGAVLAVPVQRTTMRGERAVRSEEMEYLLPDRLSMHATLLPELRSYGLYSSVVYTSELKVEGRFALRDLETLAGDGGEPQWQRAQLRIPITDVHGIRRASSLHVGDQVVEFMPSDAGVAGMPAIAASVALQAAVGGQDTLPFSFDMTLAGSEQLALLPLARNTQARIEGAWGDPGFDGAFLPAQRQVDGGHFTADWQVLDLNRSIAQHWRESGSARVDLDGSAFGVSLTRPANPYQRNTRAGKYGVMFIALTFAAFFLFEVLRGLRVHPVQYLLVGAALCTFYVVLLAWSEQAGFALAYLMAATVMVLLIGGYAAAVLGQWRSGVLLGTLIAFVYALLYGLVSSEDYALLMGSLALLAMIGALMRLTRKVDWYAMGTRGRDAAN